VLRIRPEQQKVFDDLARARFDRWLLSYVHERWPDRVVRIGDAGALDRILKEAVDAAEAKEFWESDDLVAYVDLAMLLGPGFAKDPRLPWMDGLLARDDLDPEQRVLIAHRMIQAMALDRVGPEWGFA
jgi:hypothetical protein